MTQEQLTKASRELAEKEGITPAEAVRLILFSHGPVTPTEETKDTTQHDLD